MKDTPSENLEEAKPKASKKKVSKKVEKEVEPKASAKAKASDSGSDSQAAGADSGYSEDGGEQTTTNRQQRPRGRHQKGGKSQGGGRSGKRGNHRQNTRGNYQRDNGGIYDDIEHVPVTPAEDVDLSDITLSDEDKAALSSKELKSKKIEYIIELATKLKIENAAGMRRQDLVFETLKRAAQLGDILVEEY